MNRLNLATISLLFLALITAPASAIGQPPVKEKRLQGTVGKGMEYIKVAAPSIGTDRMVEVGISAPGKNLRKPLLVVIFLHGWGENAYSWEKLGGPAALDPLISSGQTPAMIIVAPDGGNSNWVNWHNGEARWEDFLTKDLPAALRTRFQVTHFAVIGTSMGGEAALRLALKFPTQFQCAAALSAAIHPADPDNLPLWAKQGFSQMPELKKQFGFPMDNEFWRSNNVMYLASVMPRPSDTKLRIFFDVGRDDHLGFVATNAQLSSILSSQGIPHVFGLRPGGHGNGFYRANLKSSLRAIGDCFNDSKAQPQVIPQK